MNATSPVKQGRRRSEATASLLVGTLSSSSPGCSEAQPDHNVKVQEVLFQKDSQ